MKVDQRGQRPVSLRKPKHVIIGNGVAGVTAAPELGRRQAGEIHVYSQERYHYYFRPHLPFFLAGEITEEELYVHLPFWYERKGIQVHLNVRVERILPTEKRITPADGTQIPYDRLLLATGSVPFVPPIEGSGLRPPVRRRIRPDCAEALRSRKRPLREAHP